MAGRTTAPSPPASQAGRRRTGSRRCRPTCLPVERLLPSAIAGELRLAARSAGEITPELIGQLNARFEITERFGVSRTRLRNYLVRVRTDEDGAEGGDDVWAGKVRNHRRRQASIASILDATFGRLAECSPDLWERRAYLLLVGLTYERLAVGEGAVTTDELVTLANVLAKLHIGSSGKHTNGKVPSKESGAALGTGGQAASGTRRLPKRFADAVREVYGADFQAP